MGVFQISVSDLRFLRSEIDPTLGCARIAFHHYWRHLSLVFVPSQSWLSLFALCSSSVYSH
jgi:hypothetical protein